MLSGRDFIEGDDCRNCHKPIIGVRSDVGRTGYLWLHVEAEPGASRGCRAASYKQGGGWDDSLNRRWKATPTRHTLAGKPL